MPTADDFRMEMYRMMNEAVYDARETLEINAGELHKTGFEGDKRAMGKV
jgi:hypothetical protein